MSFEENIPLDVFCTSYQVEQSFLETLESHGLISIVYSENQRFVLKDEVVELEKYSRLFYELDINVPGIEALNNVLTRIKQLQAEADQLRAKLRIYE